MKMQHALPDAHLIYGKNMAAYRPEVNYPGVKIDRVVTTANPNYEFIYLTIAPETQPGEMEIVFKKDGKKAFAYSYPLLAREKNSAMRKGFDQSDVIYLLMPDRFANDFVVIGNRISVIRSNGLIIFHQRRAPQRGHAQILQIVQVVDNSLNIAAVPSVGRISATRC